MENLSDAPIELQFTPTPGDYSNVTRTIWLSDRRLLIGLGLAVVVLLLWLRYSIEDFASLAVAVGVALALVVLLVSVLIRGPAQAARQSRKDARLTAPTTWRIDDDGVQMHSEFLDQRLPWATFSRIRETKSYFLFSHTANPRFYQFLPKGAFASTDQEQAFRALVGRHLPGLKPHGGRTESP